MEATNENIDYRKIEEMVEGDEEFRTQLLEAIIVAVKELQVSYIKGIETKKEEIIKQARHKIKPTLTLFGLKALGSTLGEGKQLILKGGLNQDLDSHKIKFLSVSNA
ncbi:MAG TPA: hypothetical protein VK957_05385, partial [Lunatimonas sp.]|nr:hypothetical protein [Lunatimonas sp.]